VAVKINDKDLSIYYSDRCPTGSGF